MNNFLANLLGETDLGLAPAAMPQSIAPQVNIPQQARAPRRSALDIIGGLGDVFARVGGSDAQYQPQLDARNERARQVDIDAMRKQQFELQQQQGNQNLSKGEIELADAQRQVLGQATRGLAAVYQRGGAPALAKAWPMLAQQLQIPPEQAQVFGQALTTDPEGTLVGLNAALNPPQAQGSQAKELQLYALAKQENPNLKFTDFLRTVQEKPLTEYQEGQLGQGNRRLTLQERRDAWARDPRNLKNQPKPAKGEKSAADVAAGMQDLQGVLGDIRGNYENLRRGGAMVQQGGAPGQNIVARARASGVGQLVEGAVGTEAQTYRDNISTSRPALVQAIAKATGMSSKQLDSNADMKLALSQATDPTQSYETNMAALQRLERFVANRSGAPAARPRQAGTLSPRPSRAPAAAGGWKVIGVK